MAACYNVNALLNLMKNQLASAAFRHLNLTSVLVAACLLSASASAATSWQYESPGHNVPAADSEEPMRPTFSLPLALDYLEHGALAWSRERQCVSCHTNGSYLLSRPALTSLAGSPSPEIRTFFVEQLAEFEAQSVESRKKGITPTQIAYLAAGLAQWDQYVTRTISPETQRAIEVMFSAQSEDGSFANDTCWPPLESSGYHGATVAALALLSVPEWLQSKGSQTLGQPIERLWTYLQSTPPPHDYARVLLLWVASLKPTLISEATQQDIVKRLLTRQHSDGGWALRDFAAPEHWGEGNRANKLRSERDFRSPSSDGHQTGLTAYVLMKAGLERNHPAIQNAVGWLLKNQRQSGRWWTRSLNTDKDHFITYSGTCYPLLALAEAGALSPTPTRR